MPAWLRYMLWFGLLGPVIGYAIGVLAMIVAPGPSSGEGIVLFLIFAVMVSPIGLGIGAVLATITGWVSYQVSLRNLGRRVELVMTVLCGEFITAAAALLIQPPDGPVYWGWAPGRAAGALMDGLIGAFAAAVCWSLVKRGEATARRRESFETLA